jgi:hypothetical protein
MNPQSTSFFRLICSLRHENQSKFVICWPIIPYGMGVVNFRSIAGFKSQVASHESQVASHKSQVASRKSQVSSRKSHVTGFKLQDVAAGLSLRI